MSGAYDALYFGYIESELTPNSSVNSINNKIF